MKKIRTLKKNYEFQNVLNKGKFYIGKQITIYIMPSRERENYIGVAISSKAYQAVKRNEIKRKVRESYRLLAKNLKKGYHIVFLWNKKVPIEQLDFHIINQDMKETFLKVGMLE